MKWNPGKRSRVQKGVKEGGRFAKETKAEPAVTIDVKPHGMPDPAQVKKEETMEAIAFRVHGILHEKGDPDSIRKLYEAAEASRERKYDGDVYGHQTHSRLRDAIAVHRATPADVLAKMVAAGMDGPEETRYDHGTSLNFDRFNTAKQALQNPSTPLRVIDHAMVHGKDRDFRTLAREEMLFRYRADPLATPADLSRLYALGVRDGIQEFAETIGLTKVRDFFRRR